METNRHYALVSRALHWMAEHQSEQPDLDRIASEIGISPHHLQRTFQDWAGVSPKQFLKSLTRQSAVERLLSGDSVLDASLAAGLSGPGRLHDLLISTEALTPGQVRSRAAGIEMKFGFGPSPFGEVLVAWTDRGLSFLAFCEEEGRDHALDALRRQWSGACFIPGGKETSVWLARIFKGTHRQPLRIWLRGSPFQLKVWEALMAIPEGAHVTYGTLARMIDRPGAARAVGTAVGSNPLAWIIPCHRVIRQLGELGGYRWGQTTKRALIGYEAGRFGLRSRSVRGEIHAHA